MRAGGLGLLLLLLGWSAPAEAAFASVGAFAATNDKTSADPWTFTTSAQLDAGNLGVLIVATDNLATTDGESATHSGVTDAAGNTWTKRKEWTKTSAGAAADGVTVSIWTTVATSNLASGGNVTVDFTAAITAKTATGWEFTLGASSVTLDGSTGEDNESPTDPAALTIGSLANVEHLFVRGYGGEIESAGAHFTPTASYTEFTEATTTGGAGQSNITVGGEFRILTGTTDTSDPADTTNCANASVFIALSEPSTTTPLRTLLGVGT